MKQTIELTPKSALEYLKSALMKPANYTWNDVVVLQHSLALLERIVEAVVESPDAGEENPPELKVVPPEVKKVKGRKLSKSK